MSKVDSFELPNYPDEESKKKALDSAIQTELEFLEFAEVSNNILRNITSYKYRGMETISSVKVNIHL